MQIVDLRQLPSRALETLFHEEAQLWRDELHWDYRPSLDLIRKFVDSRSLAGYAAIDGREVAGYGFYVLEDHKGLIGGLFVSPRYPQAAVTQQLLGEMLAALRATPHIERVEAQLMPFGATLDSVLLTQSFRLHPRQFMFLPLDKVKLTGAPLSRGMQLERWRDHSFDSCARLIQLSYADHVDGEINDQYRNESGSLKFLRNIIILPGCGQFQPDASFLIRSVEGGPLIGMVLTSAVADGVGHTTQICVMPGYQGHGLGRQLMEASIAALQERRFRALSLTVTSRNANAVRLYEDLGFRTIKTFAAGVWQAWLP